MWTRSCVLLRPSRRARSPSLRQRNGPIDALRDLLQCRRVSTIRPLELLRHQHITGPGPGGIVDYEVLERAQDRLFKEIIAHRESPTYYGEGREPPRPHLLSFEAAPTYTLGRRQEKPDPEQQARMERDLVVEFPHRRQPMPAQILRPRVMETRRGGLTTYHGPGQLVLWPVLDMRSQVYPTIGGVAAYARHLEATTSQFLGRFFGIKTFLIADEPGVWVVPKTPEEMPRKIAAMGVQWRRWVTSLGIAINVDVAVTGQELSNPWSRFVPCGIEDKGVTSIAAELSGDGEAPVCLLRNVADLATCWASLFEEGLLDDRVRRAGAEAEQIISAIHQQRMLKAQKAREAEEALQSVDHRINDILP